MDACRSSALLIDLTELLAAAWLGQPVLVDPPHRQAGQCVRTVCTSSIKQTRCRQACSVARP